MRFSTIFSSLLAISAFALPLVSSLPINAQVSEALTLGDTVDSL